MTLTCAGCGKPVAEDQTVVRLTAGVATDHGTFSGIFRPDVYLHAGRADAGPWGDEPSTER